MRGRRIAAWAAGAIALGLGALVATGLVEAVSDPIERETTITLPDLPRLQAPYRIALLSDIHIGNRAMQPERLERIVAQVNAARPDLIVIAGDFVNGHGGHLASDPKALIGPLGKLRAPDGVLATMGNHDHWTDLAAVQSALIEAGITVLNNQAIRRGPIVLLGLDDDHTGHARIAPTMQAALELGGVPVAVSHSPDLAPHLPGQVGLFLAGHTHCGQVVLPGIGSLAPIYGKLVGDRHFFNARYRCGVIRDGERSTIVTAGLGSGGIPVRIGAPPDWWLIALNGA